MEITQNNTETKVEPGGSYPALSIEEFRALPPEKQRVEIARDALGQIDTQRFWAARGCYWDRDPMRHPANQGRELRDVIVENPNSCSVCAIGAIFVSAVRLDDNLRVNDSSFDVRGGFRNSKMAFAKKLAEFFDGRQLDLMEIAFETSTDLSLFLDIGDEYDAVNSGWFNEDEITNSGNLSFGNREDVNQAKVALDFGENFYDAESSMRAILQNIINNDGEFVP